MLVVKGVARATAMLCGRRRSLRPQVPKVLPPETLCGLSAIRVCHPLHRPECRLRQLVHVPCRHIPLQKRRILVEVGPRGRKGTLPDPRAAPPASLALMTVS